MADEAERPQDALRRFLIEEAKRRWLSEGEETTVTALRLGAIAALQHDLQMARDRTMERIAVALEAIAMNGIPRLNQ